MKARPLSESLYHYLLENCPLPNPQLTDLARQALDHPMGMMQVSPDQGSLLCFLARLVAAERILEIGCFTGYSAICMASALPEHGKLVTLELDPKVADIAKTNFVKADLAHKIEVRVGKAAETLKLMASDGEAATFDMAFIDADKVSYWSYYESCLSLLRPCGLIAVDNVLWGGSVVDANKTDDSTVAIRKFNQSLKDDQRVEKVMLHVADGLYLARKK
jgi:predicted O-methyltransferase YrrM